MLQLSKLLYTILLMISVIVTSKEVESRSMYSTVYRDLDLMHEYMKYKNLMHEMNSDGKTNFISCLKFLICREGSVVLILIIHPRLFGFRYSLFLLVLWTRYLCIQKFLAISSPKQLNHNHGHYPLTSEILILRLIFMAPYKYESDLSNEVL